MTTVTVTTELPSRGQREDNPASYESTSAHIIEETEYVKMIRATLEKIRNQMFKDETGHSDTKHKLDAKCCRNTQNASDSETHPSCCSLDLLMERMKGKDLQLLKMNKENEVLKIKLEASREAGAAALRNVAQRLFEIYQTQSEEVRKQHEDSTHFLQVNKLEKEQELKQQVEHLNQVADKLEEKHNQITSLESLVQRMEKEKRTLLERKLTLENKLLQLKSNTTHAKSAQGLQKEISLLQEQISHLQFVIHSQHQSLRRVIQEVRLIQTFLGRWYVYSEKTPQEQLAWASQAAGFFSPRTAAFVPRQHSSVFNAPSARPPFFFPVRQHLECSQLRYGGSCV